MLLRRRSPVVVALLLLVAAQAGCTVGVWQDANRWRLRPDGLAGVTTDVAGRRAIAVEYRLGEDDTGDDASAAVVLVPLDAADRPAWPFASAGRTATGPAGVWARVTADQRAAIAAAAPAVVKQPRATLVPARNAGRDRFWFAHENGGLWVVAYRFDPDGRPVQVDLDGFRDADGHRDLVVPPGATAILVPADLPRPMGDRDAARTRAALLTPLTVPADALLVTGVVALSVVALPVFLIEVWTGTAPRC